MPSFLNSPLAMFALGVLFAMFALPWIRGKVGI